MKTGNLFQKDPDLATVFDACGADGTAQGVLNLIGVEGGWSDATSWLIKHWWSLDREPYTTGRFSLGAPKRGRRWLKSPASQSGGRGDAGHI